ncbi:TolC family protein [Microbulbifer sp. HZ11]|uniref:TolC family protein n=1 Tax=Microbulbifer sp. HZ11 TaxID=1453501 RepID=UPI0018CC6122|nr:TolC family protein [Microbulbifer sp. HZ11]
MPANSLNFSMCKLRGALLGMVLASAPGLALSQASATDDAANHPLTPSALAAWALEANPGLASAAARAEAAAFRIDPAGSLDDPMLGYAAAPNTADSPRGLQQKLDFSQKIPWPGTLAAREAAARHQALAAERDLDALRLQVIAQAKAAYAEWRYIDRALTIHHRTQSLLDELISAAQTRYAAGRALKQDVLQAKVERADLDNQLLRLQQLRTSVRARINALLNRAADAPLPPAAPFSPPAPPLPLATLSEQALAQHPELARLDAQIAAAESRITLAEKAFYPDFQLGAGYNELWDAADKRAVVGISINLPLDRSKRRAELGRTRAELQSAEWSLADRRAALLADLSRAHAEVVEAQSSVALHQRELLPLAEDYLAAALADYRAGSGAFLNVITAEQRLLATELSAARARADYTRRLAELERWSGNAAQVSSIAAPSMGVEK